MYCPKCKNKTKVKDSRAMPNRNGIMRRRRCVVCDYNFTTYEEYENSQNITELRALKEKLQRAETIMMMAQVILKAK